MRRHNLFLLLALVVWTGHGRRVHTAFNPSSHALQYARGSPDVTRAVRVPAASMQDAAAEGARAVEFPPPLTGAQRTARAVKFYSKVGPVLLRYKFEELKMQLEKDLLGKTLSEEEEKAFWAPIDAWGSDAIYAAITDLKGFYVKTGQVISTRVDLFPEVYTNQLKKLQDGLDPMPAELVKAVIEQELLGGAPLSELFKDFEDEPLGSASIAQVHKATLLDGRTVAVKVQRPNIEPKLLGDIANLKRISKLLRSQLPVDYYTVFCELGKVLEDELNFLQEAQSMRKLEAAVSQGVNGELSPAPVGVPLPVGDLFSRRVLVMDFIEGTPLNRLSERLKDRNIDPDSPQARLAGQRILDSLSEAFERMIFGAGFLHGDPHPGNIFIQEGAKVALIDCGQVKAVTREQRLALAEAIVEVANYQKARRDPSVPEAKVKSAMKALANKVREFGVQLSPLEAGKDPDELAASVALVLFGDKDMELPGGYSTNELADNSPIKLVAAFPQELVLLGRATVLLKGISKRLKVSYSLADAWAPSCREVLKSKREPSMPLWGRSRPKAVLTPEAMEVIEDEAERIRMRDFVKPWAVGKAKSVGTKVFEKLPPGVKSKATSWAAERMLRDSEK
mmetsp:Transcript_123046/g.229986  ORF Transcript_123046/g.229986 Transcript_123046/m.229986 type:complete len:621 (-) Transcript_123046:39-1901(-)